MARRAKLSYIRAAVPLIPAVGAVSTASAVVVADPLIAAPALELAAVALHAEVRRDAPIPEGRRMQRWRTLGTDRPHDPAILIESRHRKAADLRLQEASTEKTAEQHQRYMF